MAVTICVTNFYETSPEIHITLLPDDRLDGTGNSIRSVVVAVSPEDSLDVRPVRVLPLIWNFVQRVRIAGHFNEIIHLFPEHFPEHFPENRLSQVLLVRLCSLRCF